jgi:NAD(P)-dependent dehydrogenase (short-subunit alcohol dehydrogenase family)
VTETPARRTTRVTVRSSGGAFGPRVDRSSLDGFGTADDVAGAVAFLTGPDASLITGHTLTVDDVSSCRERVLD